MLDLKLHLITILNNVIFLGLTKLAKARLGRDAVQTSTQDNQLPFTILTNKLGFPRVLALLANQNSTPLPLFGKLYVPSYFLHLTVPFPLPPSCPSYFSHLPSSKDICWFPAWTPDSSVALPSCRSPLSLVLSFFPCPARLSTSVLPLYQG